MEPEFKTFEEQVFFLTLRIARPDSESMGTGFLVRVKAKNGQDYIFLVSNKHVLDDPNKSTELSIHLQNEDGKPDLGKVFKINISKFQGGYYIPDSNDIDLALLNVSELVDLTKRVTGKSVNIRTLSLSQFSEYNEKECSAGNRILFVGYPKDRYDKKNYLPIMRSGTIASIPKVDYEGRPEVLVDAQVFPGSSGSPVFVPINGMWKFLGVIARTMIENNEVKILDTAKKLVTPEVLGIGLMIKASCVKELIEKATKDLDRINEIKTYSL